MFEYMGDRLSNAIKNIRGMGRITEENISEAMREIRMALLEADVNYQVVKEFVNNVKEKALGMDVQKSIKPDELFIKIVKDELVELLGGEEAPLYVDGKPSIIMLVGLQGSGKTTTCGKLANYLRKKKAKKPLLVACDIYRPAAIEQLQTVGKQLDIPVYTEGKKEVNTIVSNALAYAKENGNDYDAPNNKLLLLSVLIPIIGFIYYFKNHFNSPLKASSGMGGALIGCLLYMILIFVLLIGKIL